MSLRGPEGERGRTGDHGQHGDTGDTGAPGAVGLTGETGEAGEPGVQGRQGRQGIQGQPGLRGRALTWTQALVMFGLVVLIGLVMTFTVERQQDRLEAQQNELAKNQALILANSERIAEDRFRSCLGGVQIIDKFNQKNRMLIEVERRSKDPLAKDRINAYQKALITLPVPACQR